MSSRSRKQGTPRRAADVARRWAVLGVLVVAAGVTVPIRIAAQNAGDGRGRLSVYLAVDAGRQNVIAGALVDFRNDQPDPSELIRQVTVTWRPLREAVLSEGEILAWRADLAATYGEPQDVDLSKLEVAPVQAQGQEGLQLQARWVNPPELDWPAAGPFVTRWIPCLAQDRAYLLDAWLYAPGKQKYEYLIQLQTILDSFRCGAAALERLGTLQGAADVALEGPAMRRALDIELEQSEN